MLSDFAEDNISADREMSKPAKQQLDRQKCGAVQRIVIYGCSNNNATVVQYCMGTHSSMLSQRESLLLRIATKPGTNSCGEDGINT
jgi:hypothetical protein